MQAGAAELEACPTGGMEGAALYEKTQPSRQSVKSVQPKLNHIKQYK